MDDGLEGPHSFCNLGKPPDIAPDGSAARATLELAEDSFVALYMGRLEAYKRVDLLIEAWSRLPSNHAGRLLVVVE